MNKVNRFFKTPANHRNVMESQIFLGVANSNLDFSDKRNKNQGFSLIEIIVVVAILAVMVIVLAPKLLSYGERSRASKDTATMDEITNAIQIALSDQQIYDEVVQYSMLDNVSCYVDTDSEANYQKVVTKSNSEGSNQYTFTSDARLLDETPYFAAGNMRGVTITFAPDKGSNGSTFDLQQGVINQYGQAKRNKRVGELPELYNRLRSIVGDTVVCDSPTYRNSEFTVFIAIGTTGGKDASAQDAVRTYGQWSGTNLPLEVSYKIVSDRIVGNDDVTVEVDDSAWNQENGEKVTLRPGDLNGGGTFVKDTTKGYVSLSNGDGTRTEFVDKGNSITEIEFYRWNDDRRAYEKWKRIDVLEGVAIGDNSYDEETPYRFQNGLEKINEEATEKTFNEFKFWTDRPNGSTEVLNNNTIVNGRMRVYARYATLVCENVETGRKYETLKDALMDTNESGSTEIVIVNNLEFGEKQPITIKGDVTISGPGEITRGDYTGVLFKIPKGSKLTLKNNVVIDGYNTWTIDKTKYTKDLYDRRVGDYSDYIIPETNGTVTTNAVFDISGELVLKDVVVKDFYNTKKANDGTSSIFKVNSGATLVMNGATIKNVTTPGSNSVAHLAKDSKWYIMGNTLITGNYAGGNGGVCRNDSGKIYMSGGEICDNYGTNVNGVVFMMYGVGSEFHMSGGRICSNSSIAGATNGRCAAVYLHANGYMKMTGGVICHNIGGSRGGIDSYKNTSKLDINKDSELHPMIMDNVSLLGSEKHDVGYSGNFDSWWVTAGIYTQDVSQFCAEGYKCILDEESDRPDDYIVVPE